MGQREILNWLSDMRKISDEWYTVKQISKAMKELNNGATSETSKVSAAVHKLAVIGWIEFKGCGIWEHHKEFRGKKEVFIDNS